MTRDAGRERISLPEDGTVRELEPREREQVGRHWLARAESELSTASVCVRVARGVLDYGAVPEVTWLATRAVADEVRHARLCHALAELYLGEPLPFPRARSMGEASFGDAPPELNALLLLVLQSCINEGIATAYLQENLRLASAPAARAVIHELLRDDIEHARLGWAHLASANVDEAARRHVGLALPTLLRLGRQAWSKELTSAAFDCPGHGCLAGFRHAAIVDAAFEQLILPGFSHVGLRGAAGT